MSATHGCSVKVTLIKKPDPLQVPAVSNIAMLIHRVYLIFQLFTLGTFLGILLYLGIFPFYLEII